MDGYVASNEGALLGNLDQHNSKANFFPTSTGTFALRRAHYLDETKKPPLSDDQQLELILLFREGSADAKRKMVAHYMLLVVDVVKRFANRGVTLLDLILHGNQGLIHALEKYEPEGDISFPAFAEQCIHQQIERAVMDKSHAAFRGGSKAAEIRHANNTSAHAGSAT